MSRNSKWTQGGQPQENRCELIPVTPKVPASVGPLAAVSVLNSVVKQAPHPKPQLAVPDFIDLDTLRGRSNNVLRIDPHHVHSADLVILMISCPILGAKYFHDLLVDFVLVSKIELLLDDFASQGPLNRPGQAIPGSLPVKKCQSRSKGHESSFATARSSPLPTSKSAMTRITTLGSSRRRCRTSGTGTKLRAMMCTQACQLESNRRWSGATGPVPISKTGLPFTILAIVLMSMSCWSHGYVDRTVP